VQRWLVVAVVGCGGSQKVGSPVDAPPQVVILDAGAEPRQVVRYELPEHVAERVQYDVKLRSTTTYTNTVLETGRIEGNYPTVRTVARLEVTGHTPSGEAVVSSEIAQVSALEEVIDPALQRRVADEKALMTGVRSSWRLTTSGYASGFSVEKPGATRETNERLAALADTLGRAPMFPDAAIGVGARWQVTSMHASGGIEWSRTATYVLAARSDDSVTLQATIEMRAGSQPVTIEPNASVRLTSGTSHTTADLVVPLHGLVDSATAHTTDQLGFSIVRRRQRITSTVQTETSTRVTALPAE
jgi:hypothetical protein